MTEPGPALDRRAKLAVLLLGIVAGLVAGIGPTVAAPAPPSGVPASEQSNISPYPVLQRLGRWNGSTFDQVVAGSITAGHLLVMSHGWSPGYDQAYQQLQADSAALVTAWNPDMVDPAGTPMLVNFVAMAKALQAADPGATILMFSWVDQSSTSTSLFDASGPERATEVNGHRLAAALDEAVVPTFASDGGLVHLIGHSFGANVVTTAALAMRTPPRQVTLLDSPEIEITRLGGAKNDLRYKLPRLAPGRATTGTFVDNYISLAGERYSTYPGLRSVVDVRTRPPDMDAGRQHTFAIDWYTDSIVGQAPVGYRWSPLIGTDVSPLASSYEQPDVDAPLQLDEIAGPPTAGVTERFAVGTDPLVVVGASTQDLVASATAPTANLTFSTTNDSLWLTFDLDLAGRSGDLLTLFVDGRQRYQAAASAAGTGPPGTFVILYDVAPGTHVLSATLSGPSTTDPADPVTAATLSDLAIATTGDITRNLTPTETAGLASWALAAIALAVLALLALVVLVVVLIIRRHRRQV